MKKSLVSQHCLADRTIAVPVDGDKFFNKHIAVVGSTGSGKSHSVAKILQKAISSKEGNISRTK